MKNPRGLKTVCRCRNYAYVVTVITLTTSVFQCMVGFLQKFTPNRYLMVPYVLVRPNWFFR